MTLIDDKNRFDPDTAIKEVKKEFRSHHQQLLVKHEKISTHTLEKAFTCVIPNPKDVCEEISERLILLPYYHISQSWFSSST